MSHIESLLDEIRKHPGMYIGKPSLRRLAYYLLGYAEGASAVGGVEYDRFLPAFREWIQARFGSSKHDWEDLIIANSRDEETAFRDFWQLFDEFRREQRTGHSSRDLLPDSAKVSRPSAG